LFEEYSNPTLQCIELFGEKYDEWRLCESQNHLYQYYNMSIGRIVYINGSDHDQMELVDVDPNNIKIGFGGFYRLC